MFAKFQNSWIHTVIFFGVYFRYRIGFNQKHEKIDFLFINICLHAMYTQWDGIKHATITSK